MLTGKCKEMFEEWYHFKYQIPKPHYWFYELPFEQQQGVYLAFFREQGIEIEISKWNYTRTAEFLVNYKVNVIIWSADNKYSIGYSQLENTGYNAALTDAIKQANKIINERE